MSRTTAEPDVEQVSTAATTLAQLLRERLEAAPLRTERFTLRLPRAADAELVYHGYATDVEAIRWMGFRPHASVATTETVMHHEGVLRRWTVSPLVSDEPRDSDCFAITRDDWLEGRAESSEHRIAGAGSDG